MLGFIYVNNSLSLLWKDQGWIQCIFGRRIIIYRRLPQNSVHIFIGCGKKVGSASGHLENRIRYRLLPAKKIGLDVKADPDPKVTS